MQTTTLYGYICTPNLHCARGADDTVDSHINVFPAECFEVPASASPGLDKSTLTLTRSSATGRSTNLMTTPLEWNWPLFVSSILLAMVSALDGKPDGHSRNRGKKKKQSNSIYRTVHATLDFYQTIHARNTKRMGIWHDILCLLVRRHESILIPETPENAQQ